MKQTAQTLTEKEQQLFGYIESYQMKYGASPTVKEMRVHMRLKSDGFVVYCLQKLVEKGVIQKGDTPRSIKLLPKVADRLHADFVKLPVLGHIPAGGPVISEEYTEDWLSIDANHVRRPKDCFSLRVRGDSMEGAGIFEGDYVIADSKARPKDGDIVVALVDNGSTVKRFISKQGKIFLKPENPKYRDIIPETELQIQGVVKGVIRWYS